MAYKIQIIGNAIQVSDSITGDVLIEQPAKDTWYQIILEKYATRKDSLATIELLKDEKFNDAISVSTTNLSNVELRFSKVQDLVNSFIPKS